MTELLTLTAIDNTYVLSTTHGDYIAWLLVALILRLLFSSNTYKIKWSRIKKDD